MRECPPAPVRTVKAVDVEVALLLLAGTFCLLFAFIDDDRILLAFGAGWSYGNALSTWLHRRYRR
jgi:hypothetical protein